MMEKKEYLPPKMEIIEMPFGGILCQSAVFVEIEKEGEGDGAM